MSPRPTVYKFGGTSLADGGRIRHVAGLVAEGPRPLVVVVSAMAGVTDLLARLCADGGGGRGPEPGSATGAPRDEGEPGRREALDELEARHRTVLAELDLPDEAAAGVAEVVARRLAELRETLDRPAAPARNDAVLATGEDLCSLMVAAAVGRAGADVARVDAREVIRTDERFGAGIPQAQAIRALARQRLGTATLSGGVAVVQGFVGSTADGRTTTLGRGGSDFTAALLGGALDAEAVHVWTDVEGVLSGSPRAVDAPRLLEELGFEEAVELSWSGAKVLHPVAAKWAVSQGVPVRIRSTFRPEHPGTVIRNDVRDAATVAAVTAKPGVALLKVRSHPWALPYGFLARVFEVLARHRLEVDLVATSHSSTAFTIDASEELAEVVRELEAFADVEARTGLTTVTVVGRGLLAQPRENARVFATLEDIPVHLISQASDVSVSLVVDEARAGEVVARLHRALVEGGGRHGPPVDPEPPRRTDAEGPDGPGTGTDREERTSA